MARGKKENDIIINHIFPEKYNGWKVKCSNIRERKIDQKNTGKNVRYADELHIVEDFETNVVKADLDYELMTMLENETKCPATQMIKSHKRYDWREYFFTSPYLEIFGIEEPIIRLLYLKDMMNQMIIVFILAEKYIVGEEDIPDDTYTALDKLIKEYKKKAQPKKDLIPQEKKSLSESLLGVDVWSDEYSVVNNKNKIWVREAKKVNRKKVDRDIQNIVREYQEKHNTVECEAEITFVDKKMGATLRIPSYLEPIIKVAGASCEQIPWIYGREQSSIYDKFQYSSYGKSKEWKTMNIVMKKIELESFDCFSQEGFLDNYYNFVYKTLKRISNGIDDKVKRYLAFYAMEKIYTLELFEFETQMIYDYQNNNNNPELFTEQYLN